MLEAVETIHAGQINPQGDGTVTVTIINPGNIQCQNPNRPAIAGDVLSVDTAGTIIARPAGENGAWERAKIVGSALVYAPLGAKGIAVKIPYTTSIPNV